MDMDCSIGLIIKSDTKEILSMTSSMEKEYNFQDHHHLAQLIIEILLSTITGLNMKEIMWEMSNMVQELLLFWMGTGKVILNKDNLMVKENGMKLVNYPFEVYGVKEF